MSKQLPELLSKHDLDEIKTKLPDDLYQRVSTAVYNGELARAMLSNTARDALNSKRYRWLRERMQFTDGNPPTMKLRAAIPAKHDFHKDWIGERFDASVDTTIDAAIAQSAIDAREVTHCSRAPEGWHCSREKGHAGPCAAHPDDGDDNDAIARSKHVLALVDTYLEQQTKETRDALRHGLMREFGATS